jgi:hypothetical protein
MIAAMLETDSTAVAAETPNPYHTQGRIRYALPVSSDDIGGIIINSATQRDNPVQAWLEQAPPALRSLMRQRRSPSYKSWPS